MSKIKMIRDIQLMMHEIGLKEFKEVLKHAAYNAAEDTEDFENKSISQNYKDFANSIEVDNE